MITSGATAKATSGDAAVSLFTIGSGNYQNITIINEGTVAGFFSIDGGANWARLPAGPTSVTVANNGMLSAVQVKRIAGGTDLAGIWGWAA